MVSFDNDPVERAGMVAIFARWQLAACEFGYQTVIRDSAAKKADAAMTSLNACREACKAFGFDPDNSESINRAFTAYCADAAKIYNETKPAHLPYWQIPPTVDPAPEPTADQAQISPPLENPPAPPMPRIKDIVLDYLKDAAELDLGGTKALDIRQFIELRYSTTIHEKTVGMTLYRLLKDGRVSRQGHAWFFVPQPNEGAKNPGVGAPGL